MAFIVLTAYDEDPYVFAALRAGAKGYLLKTTGPEELTRAIRLVHAGHSALDPNHHRARASTNSGLLPVRPCRRRLIASAIGSLTCCD